MNGSWKGIVGGLGGFLALLGCGDAQAHIGTVISDEPPHAIILAPERDAFAQRLDLTGIHNEAGVAGLANCRTFGTQYLERARGAEPTSDTLLARYNMVNLWLGEVCDGKSDAYPTSAEAFSWLQWIAGTRFPSGKPVLDSRKKLAEVYLLGAPGIQPDPAAGLALLVAEARLRVKDVGLILAYAYLHGLGVPPDASQARVWIKRAADAGNGEARALLAQADELGIGAPVNEARAFNEYQEMSRSVWPTVWYRLGVMYLEGRGTAKNPCLARDWLKKAADHRWNPVAPARDLLERISSQELCRPG